MNDLTITSTGIHENNATKLPNSAGNVKSRIEFQNVKDAATYRIATKRFLKEGEKLGAIEKHFHVVLEVKDHNGNTKRAVVNTNSLRKRFELGDRICDKKGLVLPDAIARIKDKLTTGVKDDEIAKTAVQFLFTGKPLPKIQSNSFPLDDVLKICEAASNMRVACYGPPHLDDAQKQAFHQQHVKPLIDQFRNQPEGAMAEYSWAGPCVDATEAFVLSMLPAIDGLEPQPLPNIVQTDEDAALKAAEALEKGEDIPSTDQLIGLPKLFVEVCQTLTAAKELYDPEQPEEQLIAHALASNALAQFEDLAKASGKQWALGCLEKAKAYTKSLEPKILETSKPPENLQGPWIAAADGVNQYQVGGPAACTHLTIGFLALEGAATPEKLKQIVTKNDYTNQIAPFVDEALSAAVEAKTFNRATGAGFLAHQVPFSERNNLGHRNLVTQFIESDGDRAVISANDYTIGMRKFGDQIKVFDPHGKAATGNAAYVRRGNQDEIAQFLRELYPVPVFGEHYSFLELYLLKAED